MLLLAIATSVVLVSGGCSSASERMAQEGERNAGLPDTLRVGILYGPTTYFLYRDEPMGYEYDMVKAYAQWKGVPMKVEVANGLSALVEKLDSGRLDVLACRVPMTSEYRDRVRFCGPVNITSQVLVQRVRSESGRRFVDNVTDLIGRDVYVEQGSKYSRRLENLNAELGGGIRIHELSPDSLIARSLVEMVAEGTLPLTIADGDIAMLEKTYCGNIDVSVDVSLQQKSAWAVAPGAVSLAGDIDKWKAGIADNKEILEIHRRYFEQAKNTIDVPVDESSGPHGRMMDASTVSPYDAIFRKYAPSLGWDWRLLAAVAYEESRFDNNVTSWAGAAGVMQIMPRTAQLNGLPAEELRNPERNIATSVKIFKALDSMMASKVPDASERLKFVLAAYNAGQGHIFDAIALAGKYGMDSRRWDGNVRDALMLKSREDYYSDPVVRHGYFHGKETLSYVDNVLASYSWYKAHAPA